MWSSSCAHLALWARGTDKPLAPVPCQPEPLPRWLPLCQLPLTGGCYCSAVRETQREQAPLGGYEARAAAHVSTSTLQRNGGRCSNVALVQATAVQIMYPIIQDIGRPVLVPWHNTIPGQDATASAASTAAGAWPAAASNQSTCLLTQLAAKHSCAVTVVGTIVQGPSRGGAGEAQSALSAALLPFTTAKQPGPMNTAPACAAFPLPPSGRACNKRRGIQAAGSMYASLTAERRAL